MIDREVSLRDRKLVYPKLGDPTQRRRSQRGQHKSIFAGIIGSDLDCLEQSPLVIVNLDRASLGLCAPPGMTGGFPCRLEFQFTIRPQLTQKGTMSDAYHLSEQLRLARASTVSEFSKLMLTLPPTSSRAPRLFCQGSRRGSPSSSGKPLKQKHSTPQSLALPDLSHLPSTPPILAPHRYCSYKHFLCRPSTRVYHTKLQERLN